MAMSLSGVNHLPIEYISLDITVPLALMILGLFQVFLNIILDWDSKIYSFFLGSKSSSTASKDKESHLKKNLQAKAERKKNDSEFSSNNPTIDQRKHDLESICREEVEVVMTSLGLFSLPEPESGKLQDRFDCNDLSNLFEEKEPTQEEVKAAFDVFDENKDGFIDARELQRVLCALGLKEGLELENCRKMIRAFDENGDERIDFHEFLKFMESSFS